MFERVFTDGIRSFRTREHFVYLYYSIEISFIMPPISKKFGRHIGLGLSVRQSVCLSVRPSVHPSVCYTCTWSRIFRDRILKFGM